MTTDTALVILLIVSNTLWAVVWRGQCALTDELSERVRSFSGALFEQAGEIADLQARLTDAIHGIPTSHIRPGDWWD